MKRGFFLAYKLIYKILRDKELIDDKKIYVAGKVVFSSLYNDYIDGWRCLSIKGNYIIVSRLGGCQKVAPLHFVLKDNIKNIFINSRLFGLEKDLNLVTNDFHEIYNISVNKKLIKKFCNSLYL